MTYDILLVDIQKLEFYKYFVGFPVNLCIIK